MRKPDWRKNKTVQEYRLNREQALAKCLDEVLVLYCQDKNHRLLSGEQPIENALSILQEVAFDYSRHPLTCSLHDEMKKRGWMPD